METQINEIAVMMLLVAAVYFDLTSEKVPNRLIIAGYICGGLITIHAPPDMIKFLISVIWPIVLLYPLFLIKGLGAGDIKLFSVLSVFTSSANLIQIMILSLFVGAGIIAVRWLVCLSRTNARCPSYIHYTVCIVSAYLITIKYPGLFF